MKVDLGIDIASLISAANAVQTSSSEPNINFNTVLQNNLTSNSDQGSDGALQNIINTLNSLTENQVNSIADKLINSNLVPDNTKQLLIQNSQGKDGIISILNNLFSSAKEGNTNLKQIADLISQTKNQNLFSVVDTKIVEPVKVQVQNVQSQIEQDTTTQDATTQDTTTQNDSESKDTSDVKSDDITKIISQLQLLYNMMTKNDNTPTKQNSATNNSNQTSDLKTQVSDLITKLQSAKDGQDTKQVASAIKLVESVVEKVTKTTNNGSGNFGNLLTEIKTQIKAVLNSTKGTVSQTVTVKNIVDTVKDDSSESTESTDGTQKEDKILKSIIDDGSDKTDKTFERFAQVQSKITNQNTDAKITNPVSVNKETLPSDLVKTVKYMNTNNIKELTVNINPKELGEVVIKIVQSEGVMKATIKASTNESYTILSQNESEIKKQLGEQNIKIQSIDIQLNNDTTYFKGSGLESNQFSQNQGENNGRQTRFDVHSNVEDSQEIDQDDEMEILSNINMLV